jgi:hypothetical protein
MQVISESSFADVCMSGIWAICFPDETFREMETSCGRKIQQSLGSRDPDGAVMEFDSQIAIPVQLSCHIVLYIVKHAYNF